MNESIIETLVKYKLDNFNYHHGGDADFELLGIKLIQAAFPEASVRQSSGSDAGGDGGRDGIAVINGEEYKIACSIDKNPKRKIRKEASREKAYHDKMIYCTNQLIDEKTKIELQNEIKGLIIIDCDQAVSLIMKNEALKKLIGIPAEQLAISFEYLRNHNQFFREKNTIDSYIERTVFTKHGEFALIDWIINSPDKTLFRRLFLVEAPAGYGKTSSLKKLHQKIIETEKFLPPVYINLEDCYRKGLLNTIIDETYAVSGDYRLEDCFLILDSYDRIGSKADDLFCELSVFLSNQSRFRSILIAAREGEYDTSAIEEFARKHNLEVDKAWLVAIKEQDIDILLDSAVSGANVKREIVDFLRFNSVYENIFYVTNVIRFYSDRKKIPKVLDDLLAFLLRKERELHNLSENEVLAFSFYSMLSDAKDFKSKFGYSINSFSHQIIEEYAAAIVLSRLSITEILRYTTVDGFIISNLKNTIGLLLNHILLYEKGVNLMEVLMKNSENCDVFFKIEPTNLTKDIKLRIFRDYVNHVLKEHIYDINMELSKFIGTDPEEYLNIIMLKLIYADDNENQNLLFGIILAAVRQEERLVFTNLAKQLITFAYSHILSGKPLYIGALSWIFLYIKRQIPELKAEELSIFQNFLLKDISSPETYIGFCFLFHNSVKNINEKEYTEIWNKYWNLCERNILPAHYIPDEIEEGTTEQTSLVFIPRPFYDFITHAIEEGAISYSKVLGFMIASLKNSRSAAYQERDIIQFMIYGINQYGVESKETEQIPAAMQILCDLSPYDSTWHDFFMETEQNKNALIKMMCMAFSKIKYLYSTGLSAVAEEIMKSSDLYNSVLSCISKEEFGDFLKVYFPMFSRTDFSDDVYEQLPELLRNDIDRTESDKRETQEKIQKEKERKLEQQKQSIHELFNEIELLSKIEKIYSALDYSINLNASLQEYSKTHDDYFCIHCIKELREKDYDSFLKEWKSGNKAYIRLWLVLSYINSSDMGIHILSGKEMEEVWNWIRMLIPIITENCNVQRIVAAVLQYPEMQEFAANDSILALLPYVWWHQFIDTPTITTFKTTGSYDYQLFSVDFLYQIVTEEEVDEYILEDLPLDNCNRGEFFTMYIDAHREITQSEIVRRAAKKRYLTFLIRFLDDPNLSSGNMKILAELDIHINDFPCKKLYESLSRALLSKKKDFKIIPSWRILNFFISGSNKVDKATAGIYLQKIFQNIDEGPENDKCKKKVAEIYMLHIHDNSEINCWYIKYLMRTGSTISEEFAYSTSQEAFFADIDSLKLFPNLIATCEDKCDDYHRIIIGLVNNSLKYFCNIIQSLSEEQRKIFLNTMDILCSSGRNFWAFPLRKEARTKLLMSLSHKPSEDEIIIQCRNIIKGTL